jgi:hypothetical protein
MRSVIDRNIVMRRMTVYSQMKAKSLINSISLGHLETMSQLFKIFPVMGIKDYLQLITQYVINSA